MSFENLEHLISRGKRANTDEFIRSRVEQFVGESDGTRLLRETHIPYLKLPVPQASWDHLLEEALNLESLFVPHRSSDSQGWKSLCLHGIEATKTLSSDRYGFATEKDAPYQWTEVAARCPNTVAWLQRLLDEKYFLEYYRVRYMWLEPGGYIQFHYDREPGKHSLGPLNIALNMPADCHWVFKQWGEVPFYPGAAICVDVSYDHSVVNNSNENRIHIIIHGKYGPAYYENLVEGMRLNRALSKLRAPKQHTVADSSTAETAYALWDYTATPIPPSLRDVCTNLTLHQIKLASIQVTHVLRDHSLSRILQMALDQNYKWCAVVVPGTIVKSGLFQAVRSLVRDAPSDVFMYAHLMDRKERGVGIHEQFFLINLNLWESIGRPAIGFPEGRPEQICAMERSPENIHDDYTPLWIKPGLGQVELTPGVLGWNFINSALGAGLQFQNIPSSVRGKKDFIYPAQSSQQIEASLAHLSDPKFTPVSSDGSLSEGQSRAMDYLRMECEGFDRKMFLFNTESYADVSYQKEKIPLDGLFAVSSGFKDLYILAQHGFGDATSVTYFDVSGPVLKLKATMFERWNGHNFADFLRKMFAADANAIGDGIISLDMERLDEYWENELAVWGGPKEFASVYLRAQKLTKKFVQVDAVADPLFFQREIERSKGKSFAIWYSNIFNYTPGLAQWSWNNSRVENQGASFMSGLKAASAKGARRIVMYGEDPIYGSRSREFSGLANDLFK